MHQNAPFCDNFPKISRGRPPEPPPAGGDYPLPHPPPFSASRLSESFGFRPWCSSSFQSCTRGKKGGHPWKYMYPENYPEKATSNVISSRIADCIAMKFCMTIQKIKSNNILGQGHSAHKTMAKIHVKVVVHTPSVCHDLDPRLYLQDQGHSTPVP